MLGLPEFDDPAHPGRKPGFDPMQCTQVAHLASCMTQESYRGLRIQRRLAVRIRVARELGRRYCIAMASLRNAAKLFAAGLCRPQISQRKDRDIVGLPGTLLEGTNGVDKVFRKVGVVALALENPDQRSFAEKLLMDVGGLGDAVGI